MKVEYTSNNSGGGWWLGDSDWKALEDAGWNVAWVKDNPKRLFMSEGEERWLGALATSATLVGANLEEAVASFETATGQRAADLGCSCCGQPHSFAFYDNAGKLIGFNDTDDDDDWDWDDDDDDDLDDD